MKNRILLFLLSTLIFVITAKADEGMWLPQLLKVMNQEDMQAAGLQLNSEDLYDVNNSSFKDAIVSLNGGSCTGEMISDKGLLLTNHHCAYGAIQTHSSVENDYLTDGFWAMNYDDELPIDGYVVSFLVNIIEVTDSINAGKSARDIEAEAVEGTDYNARVKSFFGGNKFYLLTYITYRDVRLVGAPPSSIGKFGGDTDNWMWPRHTGDFALYRVYCASDGSPADYSDENVPYKPKHHLPIQLDGVSNGDYTMIFGFPGSTDRYLTSFGVEQALKISHPNRVNIRGKKLDIMKKWMDLDIKTNIQYASKHSSVSNYWKYFIGQSKGLKRMKVYDEKLEIENQFNKWVTNGDSSRLEKYGEALNLISSGYEQSKKIEKSLVYFFEAIWQGPEILRFSRSMFRKSNTQGKTDLVEDEVKEALKDDAIDFYKNYNAFLDQEMMSEMLEMYYYNISKDQHPSELKKVETQVFGFKALDFDYYAKSLYDRSIFSNQEKFLAALDKGGLSNLNYLISRDPAYKLIMSFLDIYFNDLQPIMAEADSKIVEGNRLFISGLIEMNPDKKYYPDANSTLRLTYGSVGDYKPANAVHYDYYTTIDGFIEKEDPANDEFIVPDKLKELYEIGDYGRYADQDGNLRINFISNNDITGGNSGSPVINAWGELVGTAFDGNWEAMSGDIAFENEIQRTISVDIRYTLFIIDKFAGASHLIDEMTIAPSRQ